MRLLFTIDKKNYIENGSVFRRPSVRGIIIKNGKIAMIHSLKYDYYKFPGGGIEQDESQQDALIREVREESGLVVIPASVRPFGHVRRIEKGISVDIFMQDNYYYLCDAEEAPATQSLDDYEAEERFTLEIVSPTHAIRTNETALPLLPPDKIYYPCMLERENKVLRLLQQEMQSLFSISID